MGPALEPGLPDAPSTPRGAGVTRRLVARLDNTGDVLLTGPAVRTLAQDAEVVFLAGPAGAAAAQLLPGVDEVEIFDAPWVSFDPPAMDPGAVAAFVERLRALRVDEAVVFTSYHQSPLPLALLLRLAGVPWIAATCEDYPGSLLDVRGARDESLHEVEQTLQLCREAGHRPDPRDDARLHVELPARRLAPPPQPLLVVHPGASVTSRGLDPAVAAEIVARCTRRGWHVAVTGSTAEGLLVDRVASAGLPEFVTRHAGDLDLAELAHLLADAEAVICGNTGPAHLAAAVGTPVVQAFAPLVPRHRWRPWGVEQVLLGTDGPCPRACSRGCVVDGQPCLAPFTAAAVEDAVDQLVPARGAVSGVAS